MGKQKLLKRQSYAEKWQASQHLCMDFPNPNVDDRQPLKSRNMISSPMKKVLSAAEKVKRAGCKN